jgi:UDP-galactopyranose mutase
MTALTYEYPTADGDPYYPIPRPENQALYKSYQRLAGVTPDVWFVGRLATYRYYNMDQIAGQALMTFNRIDQTVPRRNTRRTLPSPAVAEAAADA